jgi:protein-S-isoprenylcysteine O-methyltransferase Ste14
VNKSVAATSKSPSKPLLVFRGAVVGMLLGAGVSIVPVCGIRKTVDLVINEPTQLIFFAEWIIVSAITGGALLPKLVLGDPLIQELPDLSPGKRLLRRLIMPFSALLFLLLYFAANALCQRLDMGVVNGDAASTQIFRYAGLVIASAGLALQSYSLLSKSPSKPNSESEDNFAPAAVFGLRHPCFFAVIVTLTGLPILMGTWYPLFAVPGIFIVMKWIVTEQERVLREKFGDRYAEFQARTKRLIPYIY